MGLTMSKNEKDLLLEIFEDTSHEETIVRIIKFVCDDTNTNSFEDRIEVYRNTPKRYRRQSPYIQRFVRVFEKEFGIEISWYDDYQIERYESIDFLTIAERSVDEHAWTPEQVNRWLDLAMMSGYHSMKNDW